MKNPFYWISKPFDSIFAAFFHLLLIVYILFFCSSLTFLYSCDNGGKIVIKQDHICSLFGDVRARDSHGDTNISLFQGRRIIYTVTCHSDDGTLTQTSRQTLEQRQ